jgi:hypothetical protein
MAKSETTVTVDSTSAKAVKPKKDAAAIKADRMAKAKQRRIHRVSRVQTLLCDARGIIDEIGLMPIVGEDNAKALDRITEALDADLKTLVD